VLVPSAKIKILDIVFLKDFEEAFVASNLNRFKLVIIPLLPGDSFDLISVLGQLIELPV